MLRRSIITVLSLCAFTQVALSADTTATQVTAPNTSTPSITLPSITAPATGQEVPSSKMPVSKATEASAPITSAASSTGSTTSANSAQVNSQGLTPATAINLGTRTHPDDDTVVIGTGAVTGIYYPAGGAICRLINRNREHLNLRCTVESTPGSIYNMEALRNGEVELALIQSDVEAEAFYGKGKYATEGTFEPLRFLFSLHNEAFTVIVRRDSSVKRLDDLAGKVVNIGPADSGIRAAVDLLMNIKAWSVNSFQATTELRADEQVQALCEGKIDAMIVATGHPSGLVQEVMNKCETRIINLDDDVVKQFVANHKEYALSTIPGGLYQGIPGDVKTFGVKATLLATTDLSADKAYTITKTIFDNLDALKRLHPVLYTLKAEDMISEGRIAPLHLGAERYFKEAGYIK